MSSGGSAGSSGGSAGSAGGAAGSSGRSAGSSGGSAGKSIGNTGTGKPEGSSRRGCLPDIPDARDFHYKPTIDVSALPASVDLRPQMPPIYAQGNLGSCSANALAAAIEFSQMKSGETAFTPSRLFIYYNERVYENEVHVDQGARLCYGIKTVARLGAPNEDVWPYDESAVFREPHQAAYAAAKHDLVSVYCRVGGSLLQLKACFAEGYPIICRINTYPSLDDTWETGFIPMPAPGEVSDGGHALLLVGYDDATETFLVRNSWGTKWGQHGYGTIPYAYIVSNGTTDLWTIRGVKETAEKLPYSPFEPSGEVTAPSAESPAAPVFAPHLGAGGTAR